VPVSAVITRSAPDQTPAWFPKFTKWTTHVMDMGAQYNAMLLRNLTVIEGPLPDVIDPAVAEKERQMYFW
jgi:hypothetical protein